MEPVCLFELTLLDLLLLDASHPLDHSALLPLLDFEEHHLTPLPDLVFPHESPFEALEDDASQSSASGAVQLLVAGGPHLGLGALQVVAGGLQVFLGSLQLFPHPPDSGLGGAFVVVTGLGGGCVEVVVVVVVVVCGGGGGSLKARSCFISSPPAPSVGEYVGQYVGQYVG